MSAPRPSPWYQFSLRSLMLSVLFVALLCSLGVCTRWFVSVAYGLTVTIGGIAGRIVGRTPSGFVQGAVVGTEFSLIAVVVCIFLPFLWDAPWRLGTVLGIAALIGGVLGGFSVRPRSKR